MRQDRIPRGVEGKQSQQVYKDGVYRDKMEFALGFGCAVGQEDTEQDYWVSIRSLLEELLTLWTESMAGPLQRVRACTADEPLLTL